jgi:hypothetical protein
MPSLQRVVRSISTAGALLMALVVAIYLFLNVTAFVAAQAQRISLGHEITERIGQELAGSQARADDVALRAGVKPAHSWSAQHCGFERRESGWTVVLDHREVCSLESARAWPVDSADEAFALLHDPIPAGRRPFVLRACHTWTTRNEVVGNEISILYIAPGDPLERSCEPTDRTDAERRAVAGEVPALDDGQGWLVVVDTKVIVDESLGCAHWSVFFCDNPFGGRLAWGEPG